MKKIVIASDHAGVELKALVQKTLNSLAWEDLGPSSTDRVDYPDFAAKLAHQVASGEALLGVLICGSGIGMCIAANKVNGIRAANVESVEAAKLSREHNNANVLCVGSRLLSEKLAIEIIKVWLQTPYTNDERHNARISKIRVLEKKRS